MALLHLLSMPKRSPFVFLPQPEAMDENPVGFSLLFCHRKLIIVSSEQKVTLSPYTTRPFGVAGRDRPIVSSCLCSALLAGE